MTRLTIFKIFFFLQPIHKFDIFLWLGKIGVFLRLTENFYLFPVTNWWILHFFSPYNKLINFVIFSINQLLNVDFYPWSDDKIYFLWSLDIFWQNGSKGHRHVKYCSATRCLKYFGTGTEPCEINIVNTKTPGLLNTVSVDKTPFQIFHVSSFFFLKKTKTKIHCKKMLCLKNYLHVFFFLLEEAKWLLDHSAKSFEKALLPKNAMLYVLWLFYF